jgi:hypothetical protein
LFRVKKVEAGNLVSVWKVRSFHILLVVIFHYSCCGSFPCLRPKGTLFALPHPTIIGPTRLARQDEAGIYPKNDLKKVCKILGHSVGEIFVAQGGLTRMTCALFGHTLGIFAVSGFLLVTRQKYLAILFLLFVCQRVGDRSPVDLIRSACVPLVLQGFLYDGKTGGTICELPSGGLKVRPATPNTAPNQPTSLL